YVLCQRHESIQNLWTWQQSKTNTHSIINKSIHIETDLLSVGFSNPKLPLFTACLPPPPVILREAEGEVAESIIQKNNPRPLGEGGPPQMVGEGRGIALSPPLICP
ncbi:MAG: hypothetical protein VX333_04350, partial [SAR324 cluster bacterium]|nr:hypothetical protein [SAR324 cluster bacterium]